jgi:hypothetical protein
LRRSSSCVCAAAPRWSGATARGSVRSAVGSSAAAKESARTTDEVDLVVLAYLAGQHVPLAEEERNAALRRALFVFAAGGDLHREPALDDPAVLELAADLDSPARREALAEAIGSLEADAQLIERLADPELAWRAYACSLLADALGDADEI